MAKGDTQNQQGQDDGGASTPAAAPAFSPKVGQFVQLTETITQGSQKGTTVTNLFLISEIGQSTGPKKDAKGNIVTEKATVKFGDGQKEITRAVMQTVPIFGGIVISAQQQFTTPRRGVLLEALSPLEA
jgi:hypothetical protein